MGIKSFVIDPDAAEPLTGAEIVDKINNDTTDDITRGSSVSAAARPVEAGEVDETKLAAGAVVEGKLGAGAVTEDKIGTDAVTNTKLGTGAVDTDELAAGAVEEAKINAGAVTEDKVGAGAVTEAKIGTGAVATAKLADSAVTGARVRASETLTLADQPIDTETVTLDSKVYVFQDTLTDVDGNVKIGTDVDDSLANLIAAINLNGGGGTKYAASMTLHPTVQAEAGAAGEMDVEAKDAGAAGNSIASTETLTNGSFGGTTFSGGTDSKLAGGAARDDLDGVGYADRKYVGTDPQAGEFRVVGIQRDASGDLDVEYDDQAAT